MPADLGRCTQYLVCPICGAGLTQVGNALKCPRAHSFDVAREGYVNLLPARKNARKKKPKMLGDTKAMVQARRRFLHQGFYTPLSDAINGIVHNYLIQRDKDESPTCIAEIGCGEGYYIGGLKRHLDGALAREHICYFGLDISKEAARLAARQYQGICFFVADVKNVLLSDSSACVQLNIFAPRNIAEFERVTAKGGLLLIVLPGPDHLTSVRSALGLLGIEAEKRDKVVEQFSGIFELAAERAVEYEMRLSSEDLHDLIQMTPNYWHATEETWKKSAAMENIQTEASFILLEFRR